MNKETIKDMDPHILVSLVNMKLRDFYSTLDSFIHDLDLDKEVIVNKLEKAGYNYEKEVNQFK